MKIGSNNLSGGRFLTVIVGSAVALWVGGCADYINTNNAGMESTRIIKKLRKVDPIPEPNVPLPYFFKAPPKIIEQTVGGNLEYKLFYFCQHHTSPEMQQIVHTGFASQLFDEKGKGTRVVDYNVSANAATNQLIVRCPAREDAEAVLDFLREVDVPPIQVKINCLISEIYADKTLDWETTIAIQDLLGEGIRLQPAGRKFGDAIQTLVTEPSTPAAFPGGSLRELGRSKMGLEIGYLSSSENFLAMVDTLESEGYLKILMNPTLEVINGKQAKVLSSQKVPLQTTYLQSANSDLFQTRQEYEDVVDSLTITPHVFADGYIGLETSILLGSKLTPEGIKQVPIITKKQIDNKENRIRPGESLIIGGLRKVERRDVFRGIPGLKDIPLLGVLFSGRDFEERAVETIFVLTPTISTGGIPREEMVERVQRQRGEA
ncbi:MAG: type II and III secretion system protein, partial [Sedimentisphaerales bacterium]|nr:type II and III secretion system protein [Sedimentisphaerales bacterium]